MSPQTHFLSPLVVMMIPLGVMPGHSDTGGGVKVKATWQPTASMSIWQAVFPDGVLISALPSRMGRGTAAGVADVGDAVAVAVAVAVVGGGDGFDGLVAAGEETAVEGDAGGYAGGVADCLAPRN